MSGLAWSLFAYVGAAIAEIVGSYSFWAWVRLERSPLWLIPGIAALVVFAALLTRVDLGFAGRAYAAYGGVYIASSLVWLWLAEGQIPDRWDLLGGGFCLLGTATILLGPSLRGAA